MMHILHRQKGRLLLPLCIFLLVSLLMGCGNQTGDTDAGKKADRETKTDLEKGNKEDADETDLIIDDQETDYDIDLSDTQPTDEYQDSWQLELEQRQDVYEPEEDQPVLEKIDGYQYMGLATLVDPFYEVECPIMLPMGWRVFFFNGLGSSSMHGIEAQGQIQSLSEHDFSSRIAAYVQDMHSIHASNNKHKNLTRTDLMPLSGYDQALYFIFEYDTEDEDTDKMRHWVEFYSYIFIQDDFVLEYEITLSPDEYDNSTNTVLKELEAAYGFDLSDYYKK